MSNNESNENDIKLSLSDKDLKSIKKRIAFLEKELLEKKRIETDYYRVINSMSWKLTYPLRVANPKVIIKFIIKLILESNRRNPEKWQWLKGLVKSNPKVWFFIREKLIFGKGNVLEYKDIYFDKFILHFCVNPLMDTRGIGRVTSELLNGIQYLSLSSNDHNNAQDRNDVYFYSSIHWCPDELPKNSIVMIHDVIPMIFPEIFPELQVNWNNKYSDIAKQASRVVTISQTSANDIAKYLGVKYENIEIIYNGVTDISSNGFSPVKIPTEKYFVYLGAADKHKNLEVVISALQNDLLKSIKLTLIGDNESVRNLVDKYSVHHRVSFMGRLTDEEVAYVISNSIGIVCPSLYEGFGLPPLEAALLGTPAICSNTPAFIEFNKKSALFADPNNPDEWAECMNRLANNESLRIKLASNSNAIIYTWIKTCKLLKTVCEQLR